VYPIPLIALQIGYLLFEPLKVEKLSALLPLLPIAQTVSFALLPAKAIQR
jgi:hypothetical protein